MSGGHTEKFREEIQWRVLKLPKTNIGIVLYIATEVTFRKNLTVKVFPNKWILCV